MEKAQISVFWFRRDLRLEDNRGLFEALNGAYPVLPIFIFDSNIVEELEPDDARISFIYDRLDKLNNQLKQHSSGIYCRKGDPVAVWGKILEEFDVQEAYFNEDYEPYAIQRDKAIRELLSGRGVKCNRFKDHVIFAPDEILKADHTPYTVYTPYKNKWLQKFERTHAQPFHSEAKSNYYPNAFSLPDLTAFGFSRSNKQVAEFRLNHLDDYENTRDYPGLNSTSYLSPHLRFGTISIRLVIRQTAANQHFLNELIWRSFFMQILSHFPHVVHSNFKPKYDFIAWRNNPDEFEKWKKGKTGYPMVDAGMRELNATGYMHNRVRMVVAGFLCKHLLIDWRWGEAYFAKKLLDYELASNNGNWQWAAGTGCDAAPYFRVFNPTTQIQRFDHNLAYIKKWVPEVDTAAYPAPIVEHKSARERAIRVYKEGIERGATQTTDKHLSEKEGKLFILSRHDPGRLF